MKTAIEWLMDQITHASMDDEATGNLYINMPKEAFERAVLMEKEQLIESYSHGWHDGQDVVIKQVKHVDIGGDKAGLDYYRETFK